MTSSEPIRGTKPGNRRVRNDRPHTRYFRYTAPGVVSAKLAADEPTAPVGRPLATELDVLDVPYRPDA